MIYIFRSRFGDEGYEFTIGLWRYCSMSMNSTHQCISIKCPQNETDSTNFCSKLLVARAFVTSACIISGVAVLCFFVSVATSDNTKKILLTVAKSLTFACLIMGIIGVGVGINGTTETGTEMKFKWGMAAIIGIIAIIINSCGAIVSLLI
jgi:hypothetical protein